MLKIGDASRVQHTDTCLQLQAAALRTCNLHGDCEFADSVAYINGGTKAKHCHDESCEDCFGR